MKKALLLVSTLLVGCTAHQYSTKKNNYLAQSKTLTPIVVPAGATAPKQDPYYVVTGRHVTTSAAPSMKPPTML